MKTISVQKDPAFLRPARAFLVSLLLLLASGRAAYATTYTWAWSFNNENWNASANWSPTGVPGAGDTAVFGSGTYTVTVDTAESVGSVIMSGNSGAQTLSIYSGGTLMIKNASTGSGNAIVAVDGGTLAGPGSLSLAGPLDWSAGTITNIGVSFIGGGFGSSGSGQLFLNDAALTNAGTIYWTNGATLYDGNGSIFTNLPAADIIVSNGLTYTPYWTYDYFTGTHVFGNGGTITLDGSEEMYDENFINSGTVDIVGASTNGVIASGATLYLSAGTFLDSGPVETGDDMAILNLAGAETFTPASSITGPGSLIVSGGTANLNSGLDLLTGSWTFSGGDTTITGIIDDELTIPITISGGTVSFQGTGLIFPENLTISSGTLAGPQSIQAIYLNWSGGTITNTGIFLYDGGGFGSAGSAQLFLTDAAITNAGTIYWTNGAALYDGNGSVFTNLPAADIIVSNGLSYTPYWTYPYFTGTHVFGNGGTITTEGSEDMYDENFINSGTVNINSGTLDFSQGTNLDSGPVIVASTATLELAGADTFTSASSISGQEDQGGNLLVSAGTAVLNGSLDELSGSWTFSGGDTTITGPDTLLLGTLTVSGGTVGFGSSSFTVPATLAISSGTLAGPQNFIVGEMNWSGGTITNTGILLAGGGGFGSSGSAQLFLNDAALTNAGTIYWTNGAALYDGNGSVFTNLPAADIILSNGLSYTPYWAYDYFTGTHVFGNGGTITMAGSEEMYDENFVNSGTVNINSGTLLISQGNTVLANGTLNFGISSLSSYGSISFGSSAADLGGTLKATILNPEFVPAAGNEWPVIAYGSVAGNFSKVILPPIGDWEENANSADYLIEIKQTAPSPFFEQNLGQTNYAIVGGPAVLSVELGGMTPITYQWYSESGSATNALQNGGRISGATTATLTITNAQTSDDGLYQVFVTNNAAPNFDISAAGQLVVELEPLFNGNGSLWTLNGGATIQNNVLTLTDGQQDEARSAFYYVPLYDEAFRVFFTYQSASGTTATKGDGITFCLQNTTAGTGTVGTGGGSLGYQGITNSLAVAIDQFTAKGIEFLTNGEDPATLDNYIVTAPAVDPGSGDPINVSILYANKAFYLCMTDMVTMGTFATNYALNQPPIAGGNVAFVGFTGGDGDEDSVQTISDFSFAPIPPITVSNSVPNVILSWPTGIGGYQLQSTTNLIKGPWVTLPGIYNITGSQYQNLVSPVGNVFYRLMLP